MFCTVLFVLDDIC